jgi:hypothetical protein
MSDLLPWKALLEIISKSMEKPLKGKDRKN